MESSARGKVAVHRKNSLPPVRVQPALGQRVELSPEHFELIWLPDAIEELELHHCAGRYLPGDKILIEARSEIAANSTRPDPGARVGELQRGARSDARSSLSASGVKSGKSRRASRDRASRSTTALSAAWTVSVVRFVPRTCAAASTKSVSRLMFVRLIAVRTMRE